MTNINELNKKYYEAIHRGDLVTAGKLLDEITKLENERIFNYYKNIRKARR